MNLYKKITNNVTPAKKRPVRATAVETTVITKNATKNQNFFLLFEII